MGRTGMGLTILPIEWLLFFGPLFEWWFLARKAADLVRIVGDCESLLDKWVGMLESVGGMKWDSMVCGAVSSTMSGDALFVVCDCLIFIV